MDKRAVAKTKNQIVDIRKILQSTEPANASQRSMP